MIQQITVYVKLTSASYRRVYQIISEEIRHKIMVKLGRETDEPGEATEEPNTLI